MSVLSPSYAICKGLSGGVTQLDPFYRIALQHRCKTKQDELLTRIEWQSINPSLSNLVEILALGEQVYDPKVAQLLAQTIAYTWQAEWAESARSQIGDLGMAYTNRGFANASALLLERYCCLYGEDVEMVRFYALAVLATGMQDKAIVVAKLAMTMSAEFPLVEQIFSSHIVLKCLLDSPEHHGEVKEAIDHHKSLLWALADDAEPITESQAYRLVYGTYYLPYVQDDPTETKRLQQSIVTKCQSVFRRKVA